MATVKVNESGSKIFADDLRKYADLLARHIDDERGEFSGMSRCYVSDDCVTRSGPLPPVAWPSAEPRKPSYRISAFSQYEEAVLLGKAQKQVFRGKAIYDMDEDELRCLAMMLLCQSLGESVYD